MLPNATCTATQWGGFNDTKAGLQELLGDVEVGLYKLNPVDP